MNKHAYRNSHNKKRAQLTHCCRGHEFTPENTYAKKGKNGHRGCIECQRIRYKEYYHRNKKRLLMEKARKRSLKWLTPEQANPNALPQGKNIL
jgi:hypothetical protein